MSQIVTLSSVGAAAGGSNSSSSSLVIAGGNGLPTGSDGGIAIGSQITTSRLTSISQSLSISGSSFSSMAPGDRLALLVLALIETLFGDKDKDKNGNKLLAGLIAALAMSGGGQALSSDYQYLELQQSSQTLQLGTGSSSSSIQGVSYSRLAAGSGGSFGGTLNIVA
jgi:hypothetical protein